jgi:hypothetical protein
MRKTLSLAIKTVPSVQLDENETYDEYVYVKQLVTGEKVSEWAAKKTTSAERCVQTVFHLTKAMFLSQIYLS